MPYRSFFATALMLAVSIISFAFPATAAFMSRESVSVYHIAKVSAAVHDFSVSVLTHKAQVEAAFFRVPDTSLLAKRAHDGRLPFDISPRYVLTLDSDPTNNVDLRRRC